MTKHKSSDYKLSAVNYYLRHGNYKKTCEIFDCSRISLSRWVSRFQYDGNLNRHNRKPVSYKIKQKHIKYALETLNKNKALSMLELSKIMQEKYNDFDITPQHLGEVIRDNNITRKRTRKKHFPDTRRGQPINFQQEMNAFFRVVDQYRIDRIISLDETSVQASMVPEYSRCKLGRRCVVNTNNNIVFKKYTLLVAISYNGLIGWTLYEQGGMTSDRLVEFFNRFITDRYRNHLIILDNAGSHKANIVKSTITDNGNQYQYSVPYTPRTNAVEPWFNQLKHYMKLDKVLTYDQLKRSVRDAIGKITSENYKNYFRYAYRTDELRNRERKDSTRKRKPKNYKT